MRELFVWREECQAFPLPGDSPEALGLASPNPGKLGFELLTLARLEVVKPFPGLMKNTFVGHLPLETAQSLFKILS